MVVDDVVVDNIFCRRFPHQQTVHHLAHRLDHHKPHHHLKKEHNQRTSLDYSHHHL